MPALPRWLILAHTPISACAPSTETFLVNFLQLHSLRSCTDLQNFSADASQVCDSFGASLKISTSKSGEGWGLTHLFYSCLDFIISRAHDSSCGVNDLRTAGTRLVHSLRCKQLHAPRRNNSNNTVITGSPDLLDVALRAGNSKRVLSNLPKHIQRATNAALACAKAHGQDNQTVMMALSEDFKSLKACVNKFHVDSAPDGKDNKIRSKLLRKLEVRRANAGNAQVGAGPSHTGHATFAK